MPKPIWGDLGLFLTPPPGRNPAGAWVDCNNVRVYKHRVSSYNIGWIKYLAQQLNGPVLGIFEFIPAVGARKSVFATLTDLYQNAPGSATVTYITPRYATGTAARTGTAVTGTGTSWLANAKAGDQISFGSASQDSIAATWYTIDSVDTDTGITLTAGAGNDANGPYTIRQLFTGDEQDLWFAETFPRAGHVSPDPEDRFYITNGREDVMEWDGSSTAVTNVGATLGFKARFLKRYKNMMIYAGVNVAGENRPYELRNSLPGFPLDMTTIGAGVYVVSPGSDPIQALETLGDELSIYTDEAIVQAQFVEAPVFFIFRTATQKTGLLAPRLLANFGEYHLLLGVDAEYRFNGVEADPVNTHIWTEGLAGLDPARQDLSFAFFDEQYGDLVWAIAKTSDPNPGDANGEPQSALTEHYLEALSDVPVQREEDNFHPFGKRDFPFYSVGSSEQVTSLRWSDIVGTWAQQTMRWSDRQLNAAFPLVLAGTADGYVMKLNTVNTQDGVGFASFVQYTKMPTMEGGRGAGRGKGLITRVYPLVDRIVAAGYELTVTTSVYDHIDGPASSTVQTFPLDASDRRFVTPYRRGVWFDVQFGTAGSSTGQPWELQGYDVDIRAAGER